MASEPHRRAHALALVRDYLTTKGLTTSLTDVAGEEYATEHDRRYEAVHRITDWIRTLFLDPRAEAAAIRTRALPRIAVDPSRRVDYVGLGPSAPSDDAARRRFFGED